MRKLILQPGQRFGKLVVVQESPQQTSSGETRWECLCDCGKVSLPVAGRLAKGLINSCGCLKHGQEARQRASATSMRPDAAWTQVLNQYRQNAKHRGLVFPFSLSELKAYCSKDCVYCGAAPSECRTYFTAALRLREKQGIKTTTDLSHRIIFMNGVDRVDSSKDYSHENCVSCCADCNMAKLERTTAEFTKWVAKVYHHLKLREPKEELPMQDSHEQGVA